jgi:leucyl aminopeptidase
MLDIVFAKPALPKAGALVLLVAENEAPSGVWQQADEATGWCSGSGRPMR